MRTLLLALLMTFATQLGAGQSITTLSALVSDAQVKLEPQKFTGQIDGVAFATEYELSPDWHLKYELLSGNGNLNGTTKHFNFNQNLLYAYHSLAADNSFYSNWKLTYKIGAGFYHKTSKFGTENYDETQFPVILGVEMTNSAGFKIGISGFGQLNNLSNNRSGSLNFAAPVMSNLKLIGKYTNHSSKVRGLQHCGSDYFIGLSMRF